jgi:hypothetical protein
MARQKQSVETERQEKKQKKRNETDRNSWDKEATNMSLLFLTSLVTVHVQVQLQMTRVDPYEMAFRELK